MILPVNSAWALHGRCRTIASSHLCSPNGLALGVGPSQFQLEHLDSRFSGVLNLRRGNRTCGRQIDGISQSTGVLIASLREMARTSDSGMRLLRRTLQLEYFTIGFVSLEALGALASGIVAGSVALEAFGVDSLIEIASAFVVLNELKVLVSGGVPNPQRGHRAHRMLAVLFAALIAYVLISVLVALVLGSHASENAFGIVVCVVSLLAMTSLATMKRSAAARLEVEGHGSLARLVTSDAAETVICGILSLSTLLGVILTVSLGWWWADPVASLAVVYVAVREGREAWDCDVE